MLKNLQIKKKIMCLSLGFMISTSSAYADIISYDNYAETKDGKKILVYFKTGEGDDDYSYVAFDNQAGYMRNQDIVFKKSDNQEYYEVINDLILKENTFVYREPIFDNQYVLSKINKGEIVHTIAKNHDGWYVVKMMNNTTGFIHEEYLTKINQKEMLKVTGNNINIRLTPSTKEDNIIGFADKSDIFEILGYDNNFYNINYLGKSAYISSDFGKIIEIDKKDLEIQKIVYLISDDYFYNEEGEVIAKLPKYQNAFVIDENNTFYKVRIDNVIGYIKKDNTKKINGTCVIVDLGRQTLKIYKNNKEIYRTHIISGRKSCQTDIGYYTIGHRIHDYQLTKDYLVHDWLQFNGNEGIHDAYWQKDKYYKEVAQKAYDNYTSGISKTYPSDHGSHGCINMRREDADTVFNLVRVGDVVLIMEPNDLVKEHLVSNNKIKVKNYQSS